MLSPRPSGAPALSLVRGTLIVCAPFGVQVGQLKATGKRLVLKIVKLHQESRGVRGEVEVEAAFGSILKPGLDVAGLKAPLWHRHGGVVDDAPDKRSLAPPMVLVVKLTGCGLVSAAGGGVEGAKAQVEKGALTIGQRLQTLSFKTVLIAEAEQPVAAVEVPGRRFAALVESETSELVAGSNFNRGVEGGAKSLFVGLKPMGEIGIGPALERQVVARLEGLDGGRCQGLGDQRQRQ